jgi:cytochrome P450
MVTEIGISEAEAVVHELLMSPEGRTDPYPRYHRLRRLAPIHRSDLGLWILSRHEDCASLLENPQLDKDYARQNDSRVPTWREHVSLTDSASSMVNLDGPEHARLRRLVSKAFTPRAIETLRPTIVKIAAELLDAVAEAGAANIVEAVAVH